jgi:phosphate transport system permease protein
MNDINIANAVAKGLKRRQARERRFQYLGIAAIGTGLLILLTLFSSIVWNGIGAFTQTRIALDIHFDPQVIAPTGDRSDEALLKADYAALVKKALREQFPAVSKRRQKMKLYSLISSGAKYQLSDSVRENPSLIGQSQRIWLTADDDVDVYIKHYQGKPDRDSARLNEQQMAWMDQLGEKGAVASFFNTTFFTAGDSREPEGAGIRGAAMGSLYTLLVTLALSFPIGVAAALYLEEFAPKNRWTDLIEVNINNLAAVPSIVFGLLGLAVFINFFGMPRSVPLVGGLVLTLMTLPTIIIASRAALKSVPPSIREAALGMGASRMQTVFHHVLPLAMPGMMTGTIIGMAQALGETAPLLMIGMVAFIVDVPGGAMDPATVLPVQIFLWADSPERAFIERTSAAIMVLLGFLILMNLLAVWLRRRFETRW